MRVTPDADHSQPSSARRESWYRILALGCVYGLAVAFAVACSPAVNLIDLGGHHAAPQRTIALDIWPGHLNR